MASKILFHANCSDGIYSAWIAESYFKGYDLVPMRYQEAIPPILDGDNIVCVDYCPDLSVLKSINPKSFLVIDHHKSTRESLQGFAPTYPFSYIDDNDECGATLTWKYLFPEKEMPWILPYIRDRDLWQWKLECSKEVDACIQSYPFSMNNCQKFIDMGRMSCVIEGTPIIRYQEKLIRQAVAQAREIEFHGHKVMSVNSTILQLEIGHILGEGRAFAVVWYNQDKIKQFVYSLRSSPDGIDVSAIAKCYNGGGHFHAASFSVPWHMEHRDAEQQLDMISGWLGRHGNTVPAGYDAALVASTQTITPVGLNLGAGQRAGAAAFGVRNEDDCAALQRFALEIDAALHLGRLLRSIAAAKRQQEKQSPPNREGSHSNDSFHGHAVREPRPRTLAALQALGKIPEPEAQVRVLLETVSELSRSGYTVVRRRPQCRGLPRTVLDIRRPPWHNAAPYQADRGPNAIAVSRP